MKLRGKVRFANVYGAGTAYGGGATETHVGFYGDKLTMSVWYPGDVFSKFPIGQEVEVTVTAVSAERPATRRPAREVAHELIARWGRCTKEKRPGNPHGVSCDKLTAAIEADRVTPPDTGEPTT